jgi:ribosome biogenesis ATPase
MVKNWNTAGPSSTAVATAQSADGKSVKKRRLSLEAEANGTEAVSDGGTRTPKTNGISSEAQSATASKKAQKPSKYGSELVTPGAIVLGGLEAAFDELDHEIFSWLQQPEDYQRFEDLPVGFIVTGPPGTGKQSLVRSLAATTSTPIVPLGRYLKETRSPEKVAKIVSDSLDEAKRCAPCVVLVERLHELVSKSGPGHNDFEHEVMSQLDTGMKRLREWENEGNKPVVVIATTSKPELIDVSLRRPDSFAGTINIRVPDANAREKIFRALTRNDDLPADFDFKTLAIRTHGFVGEDIRTVLQIAKRRARRRLIDMERGRARRVLQEEAEEPQVVADESQPSWERDDAQRQVWYNYISHHAYTTPPQVHLTEQDFAAAIGEHTPYMRREGFSDIPSTSWSEVGALHSVRAAFQVSIVRRIKEPLLFAKFGKQRPAGVLLFGPPGCGKTLVAKAVANDAQASFILIKGPELLNKYVGESERAIRELFTRAKSCAPCILFFDEMDSLVPKRENTTTEAGARVVNALLAELDGAGDRGEVYVIGTSNRPDMIDPAVLRPGRLDKLLFVDLPTEDERVDILRTIYRNGMGGRSGGATGEDTDMGGQDGDYIESIARDPRCKGFSGADLYGLYKNALDECVLRYEGGDPALNRDDWEAALNKTKPSVSNPETYRRLAAKLHHQS